MKRTRKRQAWKRAGAVLLATVLAFGSLPEYGLVVHAQEGQRTLDMSRMQPVPAENCVQKIILMRTARCAGKTEPI